MLSKEGSEGREGKGGVRGSDGLLLYNVNTPATDPTCQHVLAKGGWVFQNRLSYMVVPTMLARITLPFCVPLPCAIFFGEHHRVDNIY